MVLPLVDAYTYTALPDPTKSFRLVQFIGETCGRCSSKTDTLKVRIIETSSENYVEYDALSYVWGNGLPEEAIAVETAEGFAKLKITKPLDAALRKLARQSLCHLPLFIDQICINQKDTKEKEKQVMLMGSIYSNCSKVVVWLGSSTRASDTYFDFVTTICKQGVLSRILSYGSEYVPYLHNAVIGASQELQDRDREVLKDLYSLVDRFAPQLPLAEMAKIFQLPWFHRLWVIQEACLGPASLYLCGDRALCYDCFRSSILFFHLQHIIWYQKGANEKHFLRQQERMRLVETVSNTSQPFLRFNREKYFLRTTGRRPPLYSVVKKYNVNGDVPKVQAGRPEDRIFGLLGLARVDEVARRTKVSYSEGPEKIYREFASKVLKHDVDILLFSQRPRRMVELPSWVPDWSMEALNEPYCHGGTSEPLFCAGGSLKAIRPTVDSKTATLIIQGFEVDHIVDVGQYTMWRDPSSLSGANVLDNFSTGPFFKEIRHFLNSAFHSGSLRYTSNTDRLSLCAAILRLTDGGVCEKQLKDSHGTHAWVQKVWPLFIEQETFSNKLISAFKSGADSNARLNSLRLRDSFMELVVTPWFLPLPSQIDLLNFFAMHPRRAYLLWIYGFSSSLIEFLILLFWVQKVKLVEIYSRWRAFARPRLKEEQRVLENLSVAASFRSTMLNSWLYKPPKNIWSPTAVGNWCLSGGMAAWRFILVLLVLARTTLDAKVTQLYLDHALATDYTKLKANGMQHSTTRSEQLTIYTGSTSLNTNRKCFRTSKGYVGLCPPHTKANDRLVIFYGGSAPFILRAMAAEPTDTNIPFRRVKAEVSNAPSLWSFIGEAYCEGIMDGELLVKEFDYQSREFRVR
jgi:hypothetical protein